MPIIIEPENPTTSTPVVFTFRGGSPCPDPVQTISGSDFIFEVPDGGAQICLGTPIPYEFTWEVGILDAGEYRVVHDNPRIDPEIQSFTVAAGTAPPPAAAIPAMGPVAVIALVLAVALIASRLLSRRLKGT